MVKKLTSAGIPETHAEAYVDVLVDLQSEGEWDFYNYRDIERDIGRLEERMATKHDIEMLTIKLEHRIKMLETALEYKIKN